MSKFSPGPWRWKTVRKGDADGECLYDRDGIEILSGGSDHGEGWREGLPDVGESNARLIAAAPEMYELLAFVAKLVGIESAVDVDSVVGRARTLLAHIDGDSDD